MLRLRELCLVLLLVGVAYGDPDCECLRCAWCRVVSNPSPQDEALQYHMSLLPIYSTDTCHEGTNSNRETCGPDGVCVTQWGKYRISAPSGESVIYECMDRFCQDITGVEDIYTDGCHRVTQTAWSDHQIDIFLNIRGFGQYNPTLSAVHLDFYGCVCDECDSCNDLTEEENCPPAGKCTP